MNVTTVLTNDDAAEQSLYLRDKVGVILGGMPDTNDIAPSAIIIILYAALFAPIIWRIRSHTLTFGQLWKPLLFILIRIITFALRIHLGLTTNWDKDIFVTQLIFLRLGPIILTSALIKLFGNAVLPYLPSVDQPNLAVKLLLKHFVALLNCAAYFCLGVTIAIAFDVKQAVNGNVEARVKLHKTKEVSIWLLVAANASIYFLSIIPLFLLRRQKYVRHLVVSKAKENAKFMAILSVCTFLIVVSAFKAAQLQSHGVFSRYAVIINRKILFYCVCCLGEYVACLLLVTLAWARIVPPPELLEATCRIMSQQRSSPSSDATTAVNQWPVPPIDRPPVAGMSQINNFLSDGLHAPGGLHARQVSGMTPRQATIRSVVVNRDGATERIQYDKDCFMQGGRDKTESTWTDIPVSYNAPRIEITSTHDQAPNTYSQDSSTRCNTPMPKHCSTISLSTIDEVGTRTLESRRDHAMKTSQVAFTADESMDNTYTQGDRFSSGPTNSPKDNARVDPSVVRHNRSSSLESLALPPTLLPHHPDPQAVSPTSPRVYKFPPPAQTKVAAPVQVQDACSQIVNTHQPLTVLPALPMQPDTPTTSANRNTVRIALPAPTRPSSTDASGAEIVSKAESTLHIPSLPVSAQSSKSHWSEDSDEERGHGSSNHHLHLHRHHHKKEARRSERD